jgi:hypothetical protein
MGNGFNLGAIFRERDLVDRAGAYKCEIACNAAPEAQEFSYSGTSFCRRWFGAALCWTLLLRFDIAIWRVIIAVVALGTVGRVAVIGTGNKNRARIGDERAKLPKPCVRLCCGKI